MKKLSLAQLITTAQGISKFRFLVYAKRNENKRGTLYTSRGAYDYELCAPFVCFGNGEDAVYELPQNCNALCTNASEWARLFDRTENLEYSYMEIAPDVYDGDKYAMYIHLIIE